MNLKLVAILLVITGLPARSADFYVNKQGDDSNDGRSREQAFQTAQRGVDALQPGDTLTIGPGEYREGVVRDGLGNLAVDTTIRAELPGTVVLRGDVALDASAFKKVDGYRYVYAMDFAEMVQGVNEVDTLTRMAVTPTLAELEYAHGSSYYDAKQKRLYISTSDARPPADHHYTASVIRKSGLLLTNPRRVIVDGLAATGFQSSDLLPDRPEKFTRWGIKLFGARQCVIRNCIAWLNGGGIGFDSSKGTSAEDNGWNLIEKCLAFANGSKFAEEGGNILVYTSNHDEIRDSYAYRGEPNNFRHYGAGIRGPAIMRNSLAWGGSYTDIFIKGGQADQYGLTESCITLGITHSKNIKNSIVGTINQYNRTPGKDVIYGLYSPWGNQKTMEENRDRWFADARNLDFRLQPTAKFRSDDPNSPDAGPYPYKANIFYVSSRGNDAKDGLSSTTAWKTLPYAIGKLRPGDTLYIEAGTYEMAEVWKMTSGGEKISIRGRGDEPVIIRGNTQIIGSHGLEFERLNFTGTVTLEDGRDISFNNCRFSAGSKAIDSIRVENLKVTHCEFTGFAEAAITLQESEDVWLSSNLYDNTKAPAVALDEAKTIQYSDYNAYSRGDNVWRNQENALDFDGLRKSHDIYSKVLAAQFSIEAGLPLLQNAVAFRSGGAHGRRIGFDRPYQQREMSVSEPHLHSVSDTTANLEWRTPVPAVITVVWGETPDTPNRTILNEGTSSVPDGFNSLSLTGLKPATKYYYRLVEARPINQQVGQYMLPAKPDETTFSFTTASAPEEPRLLYVAPTGDDANSGLSPEQAWKTVTRAADSVRAGDTVMIAGGVYTGSVRVRASGSPGSPIIFKAIPGEKVIFDGNKRSIKLAFSVLGKEYIQFDGFYFRDFASGGWSSGIDLRYSRHLRVERCFFNAVGAGVPGTQLRADNCEDVLIRNCVIMRGFQGMYFANTRNLRIENNVFLNNLICPILNSGGSDIRVTNNIFVDSIPSKVKVHLFELGGFDQYIFRNNAFYLRIPDEKRLPFFFYGGENPPGRMAIAEYEKRTGYKNLVIADPRFAISEGKEPVNAKGEKVEFLGDWIPRADLDFSDLFTLHPEMRQDKIGLLPEEFLSSKP